MFSSITYDYKEQYIILKTGQDVCQYKYLKKNKDDFILWLLLN